MRLLELAGSRVEEATALFGGRARWRKAEQFLDVLAHRHCAQDVEEDERTLVVVFAGQIAMAEALDPGDGLERQASDDATIEAVTKLVKL